MDSASPSPIAESPEVEAEADAEIEDTLEHLAEVAVVEDGKIEMWTLASVECTESE